MRPSQLVPRAAQYLERHGVESPRETAEILLMHVLGTDRAGLYTRSEPLDARTAKLFGRALCRRCTGTPLQHLTSEQQFLDLRLEVRPGVFVPRPETELLAAEAVEALDAAPRPLAIDVGTGTGAVALAVKRRRPNARVLATDVSSAAVSLATRNAERLGIDVEVLAGDLLTPVPAELRGHVGVIVSNPPYLTEGEYESLPADVKADPYEALVGGTEVHRRLSREAKRWLAPGGWVVVEVGADQADEVRALFDAFEAVEVVPDLAGRDRIVKGRRPR